MDAATDLRVLVVDLSAVAMLPVTVMDETAELEHELSERGVVLWFAALPPRAFATAQLTPRWQELDQDGRLFPTSRQVVRSFLVR